MQGAFTNRALSIRCSQFCVLFSVLLVSLFLYSLQRIIHARTGIFRNFSFGPKNSSSGTGGGGGSKAHGFGKDSVNFSQVGPDTTNSSTSSSHVSRSRTFAAHDNWSHEVYYCCPALIYICAVKSKGSTVNDADLGQIVVNGRIVR